MPSCTGIRGQWLWRPPPTVIFLLYLLCPGLFGKHILTQITCGLWNFSPKTLVREFSRNAQGFLCYDVTNVKEEREAPTECHPPWGHSVVSAEWNSWVDYSVPVKCCILAVPSAVEVTIMGLWKMCFHGTEQPWREDLVPSWVTSEPKYRLVCLHVFSSIWWSWAVQLHRSPIRLLRYMLLTCQNSLCI